jgi:hypothetical protein
MTWSDARMFFHLKLGLISLLDKRLGQLMTALKEKRFREVHEGRV